MRLVGYSLLLIVGLGMLNISASATVGTTEEPAAIVVLLVLGLVWIVGSGIYAVWSDDDGIVPWLGGLLVALVVTSVGFYIMNRNGVIELQGWHEGALVVLLGLLVLLVLAIFLTAVFGDRPSKKQARRTRR